MVIFKDNIPHVEFIDYTGKSPTLCLGTLTLKIDGEIVEFTHEDKVWWTGGDVGFTHNHQSYVKKNEWKIIYDNLPKKYRKYASEIDEVFNKNVEHGRCGGCIS